MKPISQVLGVRDDEDAGGGRDAVPGRTQRAAVKIGSVETVPNKSSVWKMLRLTKLRTDHGTST